MKIPIKRLLALLMALAMAVGLLPSLAFAGQAAAPSFDDQSTAGLPLANRATTTLTYLYGDEVLSTATVTVGGTVTLPTQSPPNANWSFLGWMDYPIGTTDVKPSYYAPGARYTVSGSDPFLYALYTYPSEEWDGKYYELVTSSSQVSEGGYLITSSRTSDMYLMHFYMTADGDASDCAYSLYQSGCVLDGSVIRNVYDDFRFEFENVTLPGSYAIHHGPCLYGNLYYNKFFFGGYEADSCDWLVTVKSNGVTLQNYHTNGTSCYLSFNTSSHKWVVSSASSSVVQLWQEKLYYPPRYTTGDVNCTVSYMSNGSPFRTESSYRGANLTLPGTAPQINGWTFLGWMEQPQALTLEKPACFQPGAAYHVTAANPVFYALYKRFTGDGSRRYELVLPDTPITETDYLITTGTDSDMHVMTGVSGNTNLTNNGLGYTAFADTGLELEGNLLRGADDAYLFTVRDRGSGCSIQSVGAGSFLGIYQSGFWSRESYESSSCRWEPVPLFYGGVRMLNVSDPGNLSVFEGLNGWVVNLNYLPVQFWKEAPAFYSTENLSSQTPTMVTYTARGSILGREATSLGSQVTLPAASTEFTGWTFIGWLEQPLAVTLEEPAFFLPGAAYTVAAADPVLCALYKYVDADGIVYYATDFSEDKAPTTVTFMLNGSPVSTQIAYIGDSVTMPAAPAAFEDWTFVGWRYNACGLTTASQYSYQTGYSFSITNSSRNHAFHALYRHFEEDGGYSYQRIYTSGELTPGDYLITSSYINNMYVMTGVSGDTDLTNRRLGATAFADTGIEWSGTALVNADDAYRFTVEDQGEGFSVRSVSEGTYLAIDNYEVVTRTNYDSEICRWSFTPGTYGVTMCNFNRNGYPILDWQGSYWGTSNQEGARVYLWKNTRTGVTYYSTEVHPDKVDVYCVDQDDNAAVYAYAFGNGVENAPFPGRLLTPEGVDEHGDSWYKLTLDRDFYTNVIFSGGDSSTQTADLGLGDGAYIVYYVNGHTGYEGSDLWPAPPIQVEPSCTLPGSLTYVGLLTGESHVTEIGAPLGHDWGEWAVTAEATCTEGGTETRSCARCGETETRPVEALGHDYQAVVTAPSCTAAGFTTYTCSRCGDTYVGDETAALGHLPGEPVQENYVEPAVGVEGGYDMVVYCQRCGEELSREHTVLPGLPNPEPIETSDLRIFSSISVGTDMVVTWTARKTDVASYERFWIEVVKHGLDGDETYRYGAEQAEALNEGSTSWSCDFKHIFAKEMGVEIEARVYAEDANGQIYRSPAKTTNIRDYLGGRLTATNNPVSQRVLAADMLNYGAAAQLYMGYDTEHLVNEELTAEQLAKLDEYETKELPAVEKTNSNYRPEGQSNVLFNSVSLDNEVILTLIVRAAEGADVKVLMKDHETGTVLETLDAAWNGSNYVVDYSGIGADKMRVAYDFTAQINGDETGNIRTWSIEGYVGELRSSNNQLRTNVANALLTYGDSAAAYFAAQ